MLKKLAVLAVIAVTSVSLGCQDSQIQSSAQDRATEQKAEASQASKPLPSKQQASDNESATNSKTLRISITSPGNNDSVPERTNVCCAVKGSGVNVVAVVIRPMETNDYWVQPEAQLDEQNSWSTLAYFGRPGDIDIGKKFEVRAFANPKSDLKEGDVLSGWPKAQAVSPTVQVERG
ncbi:MAG: hypothetical protein ABFD49_10765 [Armatimonadota bacterium]|nr:hypothetical protein [bacterium]